MRVVITGATGFVGKVLVSHLQSLGHKIVVLTRDVSTAAIILGKDCEYVHWNWVQGAAPLDKIGNFEALMNLMGENIAAKKWSDEQKQILFQSRLMRHKNCAKVWRRRVNRVCHHWCVSSQLRP